MMRLLAPLGLIGLLGVVALIIIYIIKPNYQQKFISSTFVWKLSLKYKKRKLPINKLRNILIIICQILILTLAAFILARPNTVYDIEPYKQEYILVIDSSASMRTKYEDKTRFDRAIEQAIIDAYTIFDTDGIISVIIADATPAYLTTQPEEDDGIFEEGYVPEVETFLQVTSAKAMTLEDELNRLKDEDTCSYGSSDIDGAMEMCQAIIDNNPTAKVYLYTDTTYNVAPTVTQISCCVEDEWNAGILDVRAVEDDYYYQFEVDVGFYAHMENPTDLRTATLDITLDVANANAADRESAEGQDMQTVEYSVRVTGGVPRTVIFKSGLSDTDAIDNEEGVIYFNLEEVYGKDKKIQTFGSVTVKVSRQGATGDANSLDDSFILYGNQKNIIRVQYFSTIPNTFMNGIMSSLKSLYKNRWDIQLFEVKKGDEAETKGFDLYIYEHEMPEVLPTDGAILMVNPDTAPPASDFAVGQEVQGNKDYYFHTEALDEDNPALQVLSGLTLENITARNYMQITAAPGYDVLATVNNTPAVMVRNAGDAKMAVLAFSLHYSNLVLRKEFPILMSNLFSYFFPPMIEESSVSVGDTLFMGAMGEALEVIYPTYVGGDENKVFNNQDVLWSFYDEESSGLNKVYSMEMTMPGVYYVTQTTYLYRTLNDYVYVSIPSVESDIWRTTEMAAPVAEEYETEYFEDWLVWLAAIVVFLLFAEWWLHTRENAM